MADNFGLKIGVEGEKEFKSALYSINQSSFCQIHIHVYRRGVHHNGCRPDWKT